MTLFASHKVSIQHCSGDWLARVSEIEALSQQLAARLSREGLANVVARVAPRSDVIFLKQRFWAVQ